MICRLLLLLALLAAVTTIPGCHYYINAMPHIVISSEPFTANNTVQNGLEPHPATQPEPTNDRTPTL